MGKLIKVVGFTVLGLLFLVGTSFAGYLDGYTNITINDGYGERGFTSDGSVGPTGQGLEDQEVEPGAATGQVWDMEGFFQSGSLLALVGGWNFLGNIDGITSGDIFFEMNGDDVFDYVLDMDWGSLNSGKIDYTVRSGSFTTALTYGGPDEVKDLPWRWESTGSEGSTKQALYLADYDNDGMGGGVTGGLHNAVVVDLAFLGEGTDFTSYFTMRCGNDIVNGSGTAPVPEPATMFLLGTGLLGLAGVGRKKLMGKKLKK